MINKLESLDYGIKTQTWVDGLTSYTQSNCQVTLTSSGYRIYRPANLVHDSSTMHNMWGGFVIRPFNFDSNFMIQYHRYVLLFHVTGQSSNAVCDVYWTNQVGWGGGGLEPTPSNIVTNMYLPANFTGSRNCFYDFTINDTIDKVCTTSYSGFVAGTTYKSYRDFKFGFSYTDTGTMGTDLYITDLRMYDITSISDKIDFNKSGIIACSQLIEDSGTPNVNQYNEAVFTNLMEY